MGRHGGIHVGVGDIDDHMAPLSALGAVEGGLTDGVESTKKAEKSKEIVSIFVRFKRTVCRVAGRWLATKKGTLTQDQF
jgi:hypothetical protein